MQSKNDRGNGVSNTAERMLEEMSYQTDLLGRVLAEMKRANCQLEQISRQTCESHNELHRQTALQRCLLKLQAYQVEVARAGNPGLAQLLDCKYGFDRCLDLDDCQGGHKPANISLVPMATGWRTAQASRRPARPLRDGPRTRRIHPFSVRTTRLASRTRDRNGACRLVRSAASCAAARALIYAMPGPEPRATPGWISRSGPMIPPWRTPVQTPPTSAEPKVAPLCC